MILCTNGLVLIESWSKKNIRNNKETKLREKKRKERELWLKFLVKDYYFLVGDFQCCSWSQTSVRICTKSKIFWYFTIVQRSKNMWRNVLIVGCAYFVSTPRQSTMYVSVKQCVRCATKKSEVQKWHKLFSLDCLQKCSRANGTLNVNYDQSAYSN